MFPLGSSPTCRIEWRSTVTTENTWRKSSGSANDASCVELRNTLDQVRDSKSSSASVIRGDIPALLQAIRAGRLDHHSQREPRSV
ncbi:MAG TPA: DUF397 domain-containing protein [Actinophytocola sp.]|uniref:DUF397 domain-containing protein n=1 Tax=Actinophytocola sp. TaxID=1872138 RepID=UPI002E00D304|nr:DUF397 domain-containing protein [Actinophytocola sp.]